MKWRTIILSVSAVTASSPVRKVVQLLGDIQSKIKKELKTEEEAMAAYSQWCKDEPAKRRFEVKQAAKDIDNLSGILEGCTSKIAVAAADVDSLSAEVSSAEGDIESGNESRSKELALNQEEETELKETIDMISRAVSILKRLSFAQGAVKNTKQFEDLTQVLRVLIDATRTKDDAKKQLKSFISVSADDDLTLPQATVKKYETKEGTQTIVETLQDMKDQAESQLSALRTAEMNSAHAWDMEKQNLQNGIKFAKEKIENAQALSQEAAREKGIAEGDLASTRKDKAADESFLAEAVPACQSKAADWEHRQESGRKEIAAVQQAIDTLGSKFGFVQLRVVKKHLVDEEDEGRSRAVRLLKQLSRKYSSFGLMQIANVAAKGDTFAKVRSLIEDMISRLQEEARKEADLKGWCDEEKKTNTASKEKKQSNVDKYSSRIDAAKAGMAKLKEQIAELQSESSEISKSNGELAVIRAKNKEAFVETEQDLKESIEAVSSALSTLKGFYSGDASLLQTKNQAPELGGAKSEGANVVIGILDQAEADFSKNLAEAQTEESTDQEQYEKIVQANKVATASKTASLNGKQTESTSLASALERHQQDYNSTGQELDAILTYLSKLNEKCSTRAQTYAEKKQKRDDEISGLKEALNILQGDSFVQKQTFLSRRKHSIA